jgi:hypothetical protein
MNTQDRHQQSEAKQQGMQRQVEQIWLRANNSTTLAAAPLTLYSDLNVLESTPSGAITALRRDREFPEQTSPGDKVTNAARGADVEQVNLHQTGIVQAFWNGFRPLPLRSVLI